MSIVVRPVTESDFSGIIELIDVTMHQSFGQSSSKELIAVKVAKYTLDSVAQRVQGANYFVATSSDQIIGIIGLKSDAIRTFFVHPSWQGQGVGRKLFDTVESLARTQSIDLLKVQASTAGCPIYAHFGFIEVGKEHKEKQGVKYFNYLMEKAL